MNHPGRQILMLYLNALDHEKLRRDASSLAGSGWPRVRGSETPGFAQGLLHGKFSACTPNYFLRRTGFNELQAVTKRIPLTNQGVNLNRTEGQLEFKANDFADGHFDPQHGGNPGLTDVHRISTHHTGIAGIDPNGYLQIEPGMTASIHRILSPTGSELPAHYQFDSLPHLEAVPRVIYRAPSRVRLIAAQSKDKAHRMTIGRMRSEL
jgi:hypothetical protein